MSLSKLEKKIVVGALKSASAHCDYLLNEAGTFLPDEASLEIQKNKSHYDNLHERLLKEGWLK